MLLRMTAMMFSAQSSIGITNDIFDMELDARTKPYKPLVSRALTKQAAAFAAFGFFIGAMILAATISLASLGLAALGTACGLLYDARLKRATLSALPFMVAIPTLPLWVWVSVDRWDNALWWLLPLGALIGLSLHLANTLPDIEDDAQHGVHGLAHTLGAHAARVTCWSSFASALILAVVLSPFVAYDMVFIVPAIAFAACCLAASAAIWSARRDAFALQFGFGALACGAATASVGWLAAVT
jgi:4-hydroxybenzoate polyprenyltransferase